MGVRDGERGYWTERREEPPMQRTDRGGLAQLVGPMCRCFPCCCPPGRGHNDPRWIDFEEQERAIEERDGRRGVAPAERD